MKLTQKIQEELLKTSKQVARLEQEEFEQQFLAELKIRELAAKLKFHKISDLEITETLTKGKTVIYQVRGKLIENQELVTQLQNSCGRFILATNILDMSNLEQTEILKIYKQQQSTERGFRFIKDPLFFCG